MVSWRESRSGFTLLEVMIAIAILALALLAIYNLQGISLQGAARAQKISIATELARKKMATVIVSFEAGMLKGEFPEEKEESGTFEEDTDYSWKVAVRKTEIPVPPVPEGGADVMRQIMTIISDELTKSTREVRLTVSWKEFDEEKEGVVLTTHLVKM